MRVYLRRLTWSLVLVPGACQRVQVHLLEKVTGHYEMFPKFKCKVLSVKIQKWTSAGIPADWSVRT